VFAVVVGTASRPVLSDRSFVVVCYSLCTVLSSVSVRFHVEGNYWVGNYRRNSIGGVRVHCGALWHS
jgi:hypothetical protein